MPKTPSSPFSHDALIFGGGLSGTILAQRFRAADKRVLLVDNPSKSRCSRIAAGLINPIGGKRLKRVWLGDTLIPHALAYYKDLEQQHSQQLYYPRPLHRLFATPEEAKLWQKRLQEPAYARNTSSLPNAEAGLTRDQEGFAIPYAGYLDTNALLNLLHTQFEQSAVLLPSTFDYEEIHLNEQGIAFRHYAAPHAVFAEGHLATHNPFFPFVPYKPAKGIIATLRQLPERTSPHLTIAADSPIIVKGKFILPRHDGTIQVGATYNWNDPTDTPDQDGIQELEDFLNSYLGPDTWQFEQIKAGVRPATAGAYPVVGPHPEHPQLVAFNGFGSKGSLQIPYFADALIASLKLASAAPAESSLSTLPSEVLPARFQKSVRHKNKRWIATEIAKAAVLERLQPGDRAVDATAGNGHDTLWLADRVGPNGHVFAYDIQEQALSTTLNRLKKAGLASHISLFNEGHENLLETLPSEHHQKIAAIVFNLGFLPGADSGLITQATTTLKALDASLQLLRSGGILSVTLYPAHSGADTEVEEVLAWLDQLPPHRVTIRKEPHPQGNPSSPYPLFIVKA